MQLHFSLLLLRFTVGVKFISVDVLLICYRHLYLSISLLQCIFYNAKLFIPTPFMSVDLNVVALKGMEVKRIS